jgi:hypothetical protein
MSHRDTPCRFPDWLRWYCVEILLWKAVWNSPNWSKTSQNSVIWPSDPSGFLREKNEKKYFSMKTKNKNKSKNVEKCYEILEKI